MCSVVGYIGKNLSRSFITQGLERLEYRGYDSAGFACLCEKSNRLLYAKTEGRLKNLVEQFKLTPIDGHAGVGHTRWSTHGVSSEKNAHPQFDCDKTISVVHNGIIENHHVLKEQLADAGHTFSSDTDTEIIAHLFEALLVSHKTFKAAVVDLVNRLEGAYAFICLMQDNPDHMLLVRKRSPLCVGIGDDEMFVASDLIAFSGSTNKVLFLPDESFAIVKKDLIELYDFTGKALPIVVQDVDSVWDDAHKQGHEHFMLKEIYEQKTAIHATVSFLQGMSGNVWHHLGVSKEQVKDLKVVNIIGCGTSWHAARIAQFFFESICKIPTRVHLASEFRYMQFFPNEHEVYIFISQSGETADTLEALNMVRDAKLPTVAITNVASSTMVREADGFLLTQAGHEVAVASTKAFSTQLTALYWLANRIAVEKKLVPSKQMHQVEEDLLVAAEVLENTIENYKLPITQTLAKRYAQYKNSIFLGRHISYPFAMEAALKLKEISYIFAQSYPAGELKHGSLALIDEDTPVFIFSHQDKAMCLKLLSNAQEAKARGGHIIAFAFEEQKELIALAELVFIIPHVHPLLGPLAMTGIMQFFFYHIARELGCNIDKPRNLAKSVTVE